MTNKSLSDRIASLQEILDIELDFSHIKTEWPEIAEVKSKKIVAKQALEIIEELQAENQGLIAKNGELKRK